MRDHCTIVSNFLEILNKNLENNNNKILLKILVPLENLGFSYDVVSHMMSKKPVRAKQVGKTACMFMGVTSVPP